MSDLDAGLLISSMLVLSCFAFYGISGVGGTMLVMLVGILGVILGSDMP